jgi:hypothetical protein
MPVVVAIIATSVATSAVSTAVAAGLTAIGVSAATVAAVATPIAAGVVAAAQGGDLKDVGKAAIGAYVAPKVGGYVGGKVAEATSGSAIQNVAASAAAGAASSATSAAIQGGDIGQSALLGALGSAGASIGRDVAAAAQYDVPVFSEQSRALVSQDAPVNLFSGIAADVGSGLGRSIVTGDVGGELLRAAGTVAGREAESLLRDAYASSRQTEEAKRAEQAISSELEASPAFAEQVRLAEIANNDQPLTTDQKIDALAESIARQAFSDAVGEGEQVAALPAAVIPLAANAGINAARTAAPAIVQRVAQFAANDPRFAQVIITNPYTRQLLAAAGLTTTVTLTGDVLVQPVASENLAETARLARYAAEVQKSVPNAKPEVVREADLNARRAEVASDIQNLERLGRQGQNVDRQLSQAKDLQTRLGQPAPKPSPTPSPTPAPTTPVVDPSKVPSPANDPVIPRPTPAPSQPVVDPTKIPPAPNEPLPRPASPPLRPLGPTPTIEPARPVVVPRTPARPAPAPAPRPAPGTAPAPMPSPARDPFAPPQTSPEAEPERRISPATDPFAPPAPREEGAPSARPAEELSPDARQAQRAEPAPRTGRPSSQRPPIDIETLFTDDEILDLIRQSFTDEEAATPVGEGGKTPGATVDVRRGAVGRTPEPVSLTGRSVATGPGAITGMKEPMFGGDPGAQQDVWNVRSLRLRKALGL